jgi:MFS family permease
MREVLTLLKLQFKRSSLRVDDFKGKNFLSPFISIVLLLGVFVSFFRTMFIVSAPFYKLELERTYITAVVSLLLIISVVFQTAEILKNFYYDKNYDLLARLPVETYKIQLSKAIYIALKQVILVLFYFGFFIIPFSISAEYTPWFYVRLLVTTLLMIPIPLILAVLISIPAFFAINILKRHIAIALIGVIAILGVFYALYTKFIQVVMHLIQNSGGFINADRLALIKNSTSKLILGNAIYSIISETNLGLFIGYLGALLGGSIVLMVIAYFLLSYFAPKLQSRKDGKQKIFKFKQKPRQNQVVAILKKELKTISRNPDYAFQVIVINALMPFFVIMTVRVTAKLGEELAGILIVPGVALLTTLIFIILSSSFQTNLISSEKEAHYLGRIVPINYRRYLAIRILLPVALNTVMMLIGLGTLLFLKLLTIGQFFLIAGISFFFLLGYSTISIYNDYKDPQYTSGVGRNLNFLKNVAFGLMLAVLMGAMLSILPFFHSRIPGTNYKFPIPLTYTILMIMAIVYASVTAFMFLRRLRRDKI